MQEKHHKILADFRSQAEEVKAAALQASAERHRETLRRQMQALTTKHNRNLRHALSHGGSSRR